MLPLSTSASRLTALLSLPAAILAATSFDCSNIVQDGVHFDLSKLGGPFVVHNIIDEGLSKINHTYTIDLCRPLKKLKGLDSKFQCPNGARVCGQDYVLRESDFTESIEKVVPIAGDFSYGAGRGWDPSWERLSKSDSHTDAGREGLRIVFNGGMFPFDDKNGTPQKAIVEMVCDRNRTGLEGDEEDKRPTEDKKRKRDDDAGETEGGNNNGTRTDPSLTYVSYDEEDKVRVLRLNWRTKYACEKVSEDDGDADTPKKGGWGFFTWFLIILFMAISAYLIFGSWLNYNRYGARGWDLLPHGDSIRDVPYLVKDWGRRVVNTVQGGGSRGGYSAV